VAVAYLLRVIFSKSLELLQNIGLAGYRAGWRASRSARIGAFGAIEVGVEACPMRDDI